MAERPSVVPVQALQARIPSPVEETRCYHCGDPCGASAPAIGGKRFCCNGCKTVYELLAERDLCAYYTVDAPAPGLQPRDHVYARRYDYLDDEGIVQQLLDFRDGTTAMITFRIPSMHCSSCIWLVEKLPSLHAGVLRSRVMFPRREATVTYRPDAISLRELVALLASIGYEPLISLQSVTEQRRRSGDRALYYRIGVAGFAFGNVMLLSFPEYLSSQGALEPAFRQYFGLLNVLLSVPVFLYSSWEFFRGAWQGLRGRVLTIDVPISLGIVILFARSLAEIAAGAGPGFLDSFTGLVFFMLIGRIFQKKSYDALSFDRDFRSYFPLSVTVVRDGRETSIPLTRLTVGQRIVVRNRELIPADAVLLRGEARIDYSFVTGESELQPRTNGDTIHAGGRQHGQAIELEVVKDISQSYLVRLWNNDVFTKPAAEGLGAWADRASRWFTGAVLAVAAVAALAWLPAGPATATSVFTAVLIIACPCALALSSPFALGNAQRILGNTRFYVKNTDAIERLARVDTIVFDKTGTLTYSNLSGVSFSGAPLAAAERAAVRSLLRHSTHPLSRRLYGWLQADTATVERFEEEEGRGLRGRAGGMDVALGSMDYVAGAADAPLPEGGSSVVHLALNGVYRGVFLLENSFRRGLPGLWRSLRGRYRCMVLSGDGDRDAPRLREALRGGMPAGSAADDEVPLHFRQSPEQKLAFIEDLRRQGRHVLMVGDGLNDAGALKAADVGVSLSEDINTFSPACDAILDAEQFHRLDRFLRFARASMTVIHASFGISLVYNAAGLAFAVAGLVSPLLSAILMPASSITAVAFTTLATRAVARRIGLRRA
jgi:P-type Cu+ transporter